MMMMMMMVVVVVVVVMVIDGDGDGDDDDDDVDDEGKELEFSSATLHCQSIGSLYIDSFRREPGPTCSILAYLFDIGLLC